MRKFTSLCVVAAGLLLLGYGGKKFMFVEDLDTKGEAGSAPISDGLGHLSMQGVATQAEIDAITPTLSWYGGEIAYFHDQGFVGPQIDLNEIGEDFAPMNIIYGEIYDRLGHWIQRSEGDLWSGPDATHLWVADSLVCWEPPYTYRVWIKKHCGGNPGSEVHSVGRPCANPTDCGGSQSCLDPTVDTSAEPDLFTITGHGFGANDTVFPRLMGYNHNGQYTRDGGGVWNVPSGCSDGVTLSETTKVWVEVVSPDTFHLCVDDGDTVPDCDGTDPYVDCAAYALAWQTMLLRPLEADGSETVRYFNVAADTGLLLLDNGGDEGGRYDPPVLAGVAVTAGPYETVVNSDPAFCSAVQYRTLGYHGEYESATAVSVCAFEPGDCAAAIGYIESTQDNKLDRLGAGAGSLAITEAGRGAPVHNVCSYVGDDTVQTQCMYYSVLTNRDAAGSVSLSLAAFVSGMSWCAVNETGNTFEIDPSGTERIAAPDTDTNGDPLVSTGLGDTVCLEVLSNGTARVLSNSGGWVDVD